MTKLRFFAPFLTAILCVMSLYAANADRLPWAQTIYAFPVAIATSLIFMLLFALHPRTARSMPLIATVFTAATLLFYMITPYAAIPLMIIPLVVVIWKKPNTKVIEIPLTILLIVAVMVSSGQAVFANLNSGTTVQPVTTIADTGIQPNIYFIVTDRMPSIDAMKESGIDTGEFVSGMRDLGFYVKENQMSADTYRYNMKQKVNSTRTMRYFASVLNFNRDIPLLISSKDCRNLIQNPKIINYLHANGWSFTNIASWFAETAGIKADITYKYPVPSLIERMYRDELSIAFWDRTIYRGLNFRKWEGSGITGNLERGRVEWQTSEILAVTGTNQFIMAHILMPHEPFVFTAAGEPQTNNKLSKPELYLSQIRYAETFILNLAKELREKDPTAFIIFQSDEGMCYPKPRELNKDLTLTQWNGVMTAWYIPGRNPLDLPGLKHTEILQYIMNELLP